MNREARRSVRRYPFVATAEVQGAIEVRSARVHDLSVAGAYLSMPEPFCKDATVRIKIRTKSEFFQVDATVKHSSPGLGMGVMFHTVSPPFLIVLREWLAEAEKPSAKQDILW